MIESMRIPGIVLMENAALGVARRVMERARPCVVHVYCGVGNNGGDGLAAARALLAHGYDAYALIVGDPLNLEGDAAQNYQMFLALRGRAYSFTDMAGFYELKLPRPSVIVDALFGTGLAREVSGVYRGLIEHINAQEALRVSVDIPSGVSADTGQVMGAGVRADYTVTMQYPKPGHFIFPGRAHTGELDIVKIGVDEGCDVPRRSGVSALLAGDADVWLPRRRPDAHKGDHGRLLLVAGSVGMAGAAVLAARAAARAGAGLVTLASTEEVVQVVQQSVPEATCRILTGEEGQLEKRSIFDIARIIKGKTALAIGPGLGTGEDILEIVTNVVTGYHITKVLDADALNVLANRPAALREHAGRLVLTPHPREFSRLAGLGVKEILADPVACARDFVVKYDVVLVLKGATTVVADRARLCLVCGGSPGMAKGGSGDVLTGVIGGFAAQGMSAYESALLGVYFTAMAGRRAADAKGEYSMTPADTLDHLGAVMRETLEEAYDPAAGPDMFAAADETEGAPPAEEGKSAEQALAEIEEKERTQEMGADEPGREGARVPANGEKPAGQPTRRKIG
jgi:NAD(P)H-hydrate epimerase